MESRRCGLSFFFFLSVRQYLKDIHSLLSLNFMQQAATGCYFKISKSHQKILVWVLVWEKELVEKCSLVRINPREKSKRERRSVGFLPQPAGRLCHEKASDPLTRSKLDGEPILLLRFGGKERNSLVRGVWRMASPFHQLHVLVWKNWLGVKRQPVSKTREGVLGERLQTILKCSVRGR